MSHKFVAGAGLLVLAGWGISGLAVAGSDIKQVDLTLRIPGRWTAALLREGKRCEIWQCDNQQDRWYQLPTGCEIHPQLR